MLVLAVLLLRLQNTVKINVNEENLYCFIYILVVHKKIVHVLVCSPDQYIIIHIFLERFEEIEVKVIM